MRRYAWLCASALTLLAAHAGAQNGPGAEPAAPGGLPAMGGIGGPIPMGPAPQTPTAPSPFGGPTAQNPTPLAPPSDAATQPGATGPGFGRDAPPAVPPAAPARQNYADELTDFHVPPQSTLQTNVASETPLSIPGGHLITTAEVRQTRGMQVLLVDVLQGQPHPSLPGANWWPGAGDAGSFNDTIQQNLWKALSQATHMTRAYPIVFFCAGSRCWESYNAALRAVNMGFTTVLWYRGGLASWQAAGLPMTGNPPMASAPAPQGGIGFGAP